jgi:hypothetical protein
MAQRLRALVTEQKGERQQLTAGLVTYGSPAKEGNIHVGTHLMYLFRIQIPSQQWYSRHST